MNSAHRARVRAVLSLVLITPSMVFADGPSLSAILKDILYDQSAIAASPLRANGPDALLWVPATLATTGLAVRWNARSSIDERVASHFADASGTKRDVMSGVTELGNAAVPFGLSALGYGVGRLWRASPLADRWGEYDHLQSFSAHWFEALVDVSIWGEFIKIAAGRSRPESAPFRSEFLGPSGYFRNTGKNSSFVSGHTTVSFASAAVISREFPTPWVVVPVYLAAGGVGFSRIYLDQHWVSDVVAGAALGQGIGTLVENRHRKNNPTAGVWQPWVSDGGTGIVWTRRY